MNEVYWLKFHRASFGDTPYGDIPLVGQNQTELSDLALEGLFSRFTATKDAKLPRKAPCMAALLDKNEHVVARYEVKPVVPGKGIGAFEIPPELWHKNMPGTPSPSVLSNFDEDE